MTHPAGVWAAGRDMAGRDVVLVVADAADTTADGVCAVLARRGQPYFRFDTAEVPGRLALDLTFEPPGDPGGPAAPEWTGQLRRTDRPGEDRPRDPASLAAIELARVRSVYLRRPRPFEVPAHLSAGERWHAATECRYALGGVLASLPVPQLNHPSRSADAAYKPRQLAELRACGLTVPPTLVTNSGAAVQAFAARHGELICKALAATVLHVGDTAHIAYTRRVTAADLAGIDRPGSGIDYAAHLFQPFIESSYAVRLIVVGAAVFAVRIDAHSDRARTDWRSDYEHLTYQSITLPDEVLARVRAYMIRAGLHYGAWDFLGHADGTLTCLECNPEGNYAWLEDVTPVRITEAVAEFLTDPAAHGAATSSGASGPDQGAPGAVAPALRRMVS